MELKPETFFVGVIDFFSVMLPGAVVTYLIKGPAECALIGPIFPPYSSEAAGWAIFLFASYLLGHFIFLLGSKLDGTYKRIRDATGGPGCTINPSFVARWLAKMFFSKDPDLAIVAVLELKKECLPDVNEEPVVNAFQWAKARLTIECPAALSEVQRFEADSKFFRSLVVVLLVVAIWVSAKAMLGKPDWVVVSICVALSLLAYACYATRRFKATQHAYWYLLTLEKCSPRPGDKQSP
jgi:hypothetical protein